MNRKGRIKMGKTLKIGDVVWLNARMKLADSEPNLRKCMIVKANKTSIYVQEPEGKGALYRLSARTLKGSNQLHVLTGYMEESSYWKEIEEKDQKNRLETDIRERLRGLSLEQLKKIQEIIQD